MIVVDPSARLVAAIEQIRRSLEPFRQVVDAIGRQALELEAACRLTRSDIDGGS